MSASLLLDVKKDRPVTLEQLERMKDPEPMGNRHRPYRYDEIVRTLIDSVGERGYEVVKNEMALSRGDKMLLGVLQLRAENTSGHAVAGTNLRSDIALGYRGSYAQLSALKCVAGETVFLCSNLIMSGDMFIVARKFTTGMNLKQAMEAGLDEFDVQHHILSGKLEALTDAKISDNEVKQFVFDSVTNGNLPLALTRSVAEWYFGSPYGGPDELPGDTAPRTKFGLYNAYTRSLRPYAAQPRFEHTKEVGRMFGL